MFSLVTKTVSSGAGAAARRQCLFQNRQALRAFAGTPASSLRQGHIFKAKDGYHEVISFKQVKQGRMAVQYGIESKELSSGKLHQTKYGEGGNVQLVETTKYEMLVLYSDDNNLVVADADYNEENVPLSMIPQAYARVIANLGEEGQEVKLVLHKDGNK
eukprot:gene227-53_t